MKDSNGSSNCWQITKNKKYGVVLFNFKASSKKHLSLEIGETVHILEECCGWFRGFSTRNRSKRGTFPANFIALKPFKIENEGLFENVTPHEDPVSLEVVRCLRQWHLIWRNDLYVKRNVELFEKITAAINGLIEWRRQLITGTLTVDQIRELRLRITAKIDWGNRQLGLDLVPRIDGNIVDPEIISPLELHQIHLDSSDGAETSSRSSNASSHSTGSGNSNASTSNLLRVHTYFLYLHVRDISLAISNPDDNFLITFSIFNYCNNSYISEKFVTRISANHCDVHKLNISTVFTDLGIEDVSRDVYLVMQVFRCGKMLVVDSKSLSKHTPSSSILPSSSSSFDNYSSSVSRCKRPYGSAILSLSEVIKSEGLVKECPIKLYASSSETDFHQIHEMLLRKQTNKLNQLQNSSITIAVKFLSGPDSNKVVMENPLIFKNVTCLTAKRRFPDIIMPGDVRNDLYLNLENGEFEKGGKSIPKNIEATIALYDKDGVAIKDSISFGCGLGPVSRYRSLVLYHTNNPRWMEFVKVLIPLEIFDVRAFIRIDYYHCSAKESSNHQKEKKFLGFSFIPLSDEQGTIIMDGFHELYVYRCNDVNDPRKLLADPPSYLMVPFGPKDLRGNLQTTSTVVTRSPKEMIHVRTFLCSTKLTQNSDLLALLKWRSNPETVSEALMKVLRLNGEEIVKFLQDILDALFSMFSTHDGNTTHYTGLVFKVLLHIFCLLEDPKYEHFKPVLGAYIEGHFSAALVYKGLLHCVKQCVDLVRDTDSQEKAQSCFKSLKWIFKFIVQSRILFARATGDSNEDLFRQDLFALFASFNRMLSSSHDSLMFCHIKIIDNLSSIYTELLRVLCPMDLVKIIKVTINCLPFVDSYFQIIKAKLRCIQETIKNEKLLEDPESRRELIDLFSRHLKEHIRRQQELKLCSVITANILIFLHKERMNIVSGGGSGLGTKSALSKDVEILVINLVEPLVGVIIALSSNKTTNLLNTSLLHSFISSLTTILRLMEDFHFTNLLNSKTRREKKDLLLQIFFVFEKIFEPSMFPSDWMVVKMMNNHVILCSLQEFSLILTRDFLGDPNSAFDEHLWTSYFNLSVSFLTQSTLQLETFCDAKRESILDKYGDMRVLMGFQILSMWEKLGDYKINFIPTMVAPFLEVTLVPEKELRKATLPIFYDMIDTEYKSDGSFKQVESKLIDKLDILVSENKGDDDFRKLFETILLDKVKEENPIWQEQGIQMIHSITKLLELLLDYRYVMNGDENRDKRMSCTVNLLKFYKNEINRKEMYIRYIYKLYDLHIPADNFTEAAFTLKLHSELLDWTWSLMSMDPFSNSDQRLEWQRKEALYLIIIENFDKGKCWEEGMPLIKELAEFYEKKLFDYQKLSCLLKTQARFLDNILTQLRPEPEYFRVGFYGLGFPLFLRNKEFVYRGLEYEKVGAFTARVQTEFPQAHIMTKNVPPDEPILSSRVQFIQICNVKPVPHTRPEFENVDVPEKVMSYYLVNDVKTFTFDRPVHKGVVDKDNEFKSLWIERTTLTVDSKLPGILRWSEVVQKAVSELTPIEHACETVENMNKELNKLITAYNNDHKRQLPLSPLSMRLQGVIEAAVNGGIAKYQDAFFNPKFIHSHPDQMNCIRRLKQLILQKVRLLEGGLSVHARIAPPELQPLQTRLVERFSLMRHNVAEASAYVVDHRLDNVLSRKASIVHTPLPPIPLDSNTFASPSRETASDAESHHEDEIYSVPQDCYLNSIPPLPERNSPAPAPPLPPSRPRSTGFPSTMDGQLLSCSPAAPLARLQQVSSASQVNGIIQRSRSIPRSQNLSQYQHQHLLQQQHSLPNHYSLSPTKENMFPAEVPPLPPRNTNTLDRPRRSIPNNVEEEKPALPKRTRKKAPKDSNLVVPIECEANGLQVRVPPPLPNKRAPLLETEDSIDLGSQDNLNGASGGHEVETTLGCNTDEISLKSASSVSTISISEGVSSASSVDNGAAPVPLIEHEQQTDFCEDSNTELV